MVIKTSIDNKSFTAQIKELEHKLKYEQKKLNSMLNFKTKGYVIDNNKLIETKANIEKLNNKIISLQSNMSNNSISDNFSRATKSLKRFGLALFSVSGIYRIASKASSSYLATDSKTTSEMESNWVALSTILEPVIKYISNLLKKAVTSILYFMSQLTGTDYIAKANANALKKQADATNALTKANNKAIASFDELNTVSSNSSSSSGGNDSITSLFDINDISESARNAIGKIAKVLQPVYDIVKDIIKWAADNPETIFAILGGVGLLNMLSKVIGMAGVGGLAGTGLAGIYGLLLAIISVGVITICIKTVVDEFKEMVNDIEGADKNIQQIKEATKKYNKETTELAQKTGKTAKEIDGLTKSLSYSAKTGVKTTEAMIEYKNTHKYSIPILGDLKRAADQLTDSYYTMRGEMIRGIDTSYQNIKALEAMYNAGELNEEQTKIYKETLKEFIKTVGQDGTSVEALTKTFDLNKKEAENVKIKYDDVMKSLIDVSYETDDTTSKFDLLKQIMNKLPKNIRTLIETNSDKTKKDIGSVKTEIDKLPTNKNFNVNMTATTSGFKNTFNSLFSSLTSGLSWLGIKIPTIKLDTGGIVNNPGHGVPIGVNAVGGEVRKEGVIPLTDSQAMEELGSTIGRYITVNLTNINKLDSRTLSRETKKVQSDIDFATNR